MVSMLQKTEKFLRQNYYWLIVALLLTVVAFIVVDLLSDDYRMQMDVVAHEFLVEKLRSPMLTNVAKFITVFGSTLAMGAVSLIVIAITRNRRIAGLLILNLAIAAVINTVIKDIIQRPRPLGYRLVSETGFSFPSGHSMISMALYGFIIYLIYRYVRNRKLKWACIISLSVLIVLIGLSRIYLGVHYASDVLAGLLISLACLMIYLRATKKYFPHKL